MIAGGLPGDVVAVVGGERRNAELAADLEQALADAAFDLDAVVHQLEEVVLGPEDLPPLGCRLQRLAFVAQPKAGLHLARRAAGGGDDPCGVFGDDLGVHPRPLAQLPLEGRQRRQLEEVAQAGGVLGDHRHVGVRTAARDVVALLAGIAPQDALGVEPGTGGDVGLDTDDRGDAHFGCGVVELAGSEHVAVVGHADRGHLQALRLGQHGLDLGCPVQHRVLGVVVEVHEARTAMTEDQTSLERLREEQMDRP